MNKILSFLRNWALPVSMLIGATAYIIWSKMDITAESRRTAADIVAIVQPLLIFAMLFISFCKVDPRQFTIFRWHAKGVLIQMLGFAMGVPVVVMLSADEWISVSEAWMLCMICPTATAAAVVTQKLGGNGASLVTYTMIINICTAVVISATVPLLNPDGEVTFIIAFLKIMAKVFPMLICPLLLAVLTRYLAPAFHKKVIGTKDLAFYIWAVSLSLAIAVSTRGVMHSNAGLSVMGGIAIASLLACVVQFAIGKKLGAKEDDVISSGQALGQKNTVFAIWAGYTFFTPLSALSGGFYSIWHNVFNSYQLYNKRKAESGK